MKSQAQFLQKMPMAGRPNPDEAPPLKKENGTKLEMFSSYLVENYVGFEAWPSQGRSSFKTYDDEQRQKLTYQAN